jgi:hypothetical protein
MVSEFTKNNANNNNEEVSSHVSASRHSLAKFKSGGKDEDDDTQCDSSLNQTLSKLPPQMAQHYQSLEPEMDMSMDSWSFDTYQVDEHPLLYIYIWIMEKTDLLNVFNFDSDLFIKFVLSIEKSYRAENPYHNMFHGADVLQAVYYLSKLDSISLKFSDLDLLSLFFAAAVHDVDHPGLNNNFLVTTDSPLAMMYNNRSVLENHHVSFAFRVHEEYPVWSSLSRSMFRKFREWAIELVLSTDFSQHFGVLGEFKSKVSQIFVTDHD